MAGKDPNGVAGVSKSSTVLAILATTSSNCSLLRLPISCLITARAPSAGKMRLKETNYVKDAAVSESARAFRLAQSARAHLEDILGEVADAGLPGPCLQVR